MSEQLNLTAERFETETLQSEVPVLVDFWAVWCPPCRALTPAIEALAEEYNGRAKVFKVNVDEEPELAVQYNIRSIPALVFFQNGSVADQIIGAVPKAQIKGVLDRLLAE